MDWTKTSNLDFLNRVPGGAPAAHDAHAEGDAAKKTVGLEEMALIYPATVPGTEEEIRAEFVNTMLRTKTKAQRDAVIGTGMLPVAFGIDVMLTLVWPFGGLAEVDGVWAYSSFRGAKTARSVTKRLNSSAAGGDASTDSSKMLKLTFTPSPRLDMLAKYLASECHQVDSTLFASSGPRVTETDVLHAIGWSPSQTGGEKNWEDDQWETTEVKDDLKSMMHKAAKEWKSWCHAYEKNPAKAMKK
ncbi:hypothetical protein MRB53_039022 [Persea americana]|nr:hypothetical protein MRB53_039022 [Persea americana]